MYIYTTIASENDAIHLSGHLGEGKKGYVNCTITFWELKEEAYRVESDKIYHIVDNPKFIIYDLLPHLEKFCDIQKYKEYELPKKVSDALGYSCVDPYELRDMIKKGMSMGLIPSGNPLNDVNSFFD